MWCKKKSKTVVNYVMTLTSISTENVVPTSWHWRPYLLRTLCQRSCELHWVEKWGFEICYERGLSFTVNGQTPFFTNVSVVVRQTLFLELPLAQTERKHYNLTFLWWRGGAERGWVCRPHLPVENVVPTSWLCRPYLLWTLCQRHDTVTHIYWERCANVMTLSPISTVNVVPTSWHCHSYLLRTVCQHHDTAAHIYWECCVNVMTLPPISTENVVPTPWHCRPCLLRTLCQRHDTVAHI